jgi:hypothetical protein
MKKTLFSLIFVFSFISAYAQEQAEIPKKREIGLANISLNGASLVYKKEIKPNIYRRFSFALLNLSYNQVPKASQNSADIGFRFGREKRKTVKGKLRLMHGLQYDMGANFFKNTIDNFNLKISNEDFKINLGVAYLLGFNYCFSEDFYIGIETTPTISSGYFFKKTTERIVYQGFSNLSLLANNNVRLTALYCF